MNNGVPNQLTMYINNFQNDLWMRNDGYFAQENWTHKRLTLQRDPGEAAGDFAGQPVLPRRDRVPAAPQVVRLLHGS